MYCVLCFLTGFSFKATGETFSTQVMYGGDHYDAVAIVTVVFCPV